MVTSFWSAYYVACRLTKSESDTAELTDKGRQTTLCLGQRLRYLYVQQLSLTPRILTRTDQIHLRSSPYPRALHSLQQVFNGLYPYDRRARSLPPLTIVTRPLLEETLLPNEIYCQRFIELSKAYSRRSAQKCECNPARASGGRVQFSVLCRERNDRNGLPQLSAAEVDAPSAARGRRFFAQSSRHLGHHQHHAGDSARINHSPSSRIL